MALLHNVILRGWNSIYLQAPHIKPEDFPDFIGYASAWCRFVKAHHDDEVHPFFPSFSFAYRLTLHPSIGGKFIPKAR